MAHPNGPTAFDAPDENKLDPLVILGSTGLKQSGGYIDEEFLARLRGMQGIRYYKEMIDNSPIIAAALNVIEMLIRQVEWRVEPANESDAAKAEAEETEGALEDMSHTFEDFISEALSMVWAGFAPFEIVYKLRKGPSDDPTTNSQYNDGKFGWRKFEIRGQETLQRWEFDEEGGLLGWHQMDPSAQAKGVVFIPMEKALLFRTKAFKGNPEGKSLIRAAVIPYHYLKRIQQFEATGIERDLTGMPIMEVPPELLLSDASAEDVATRQYLERFVTQVRMDERWGGLVPAEMNMEGKPTGFKFKLMTTGGRRMIDTNSIVKRYETRMLMLFLAQFLVMGMDKVGSLALSSNMTDLFGTSLGTIMDIIASVFNRFAIRRRQELNGKPVELDPYMVHGDIEGPDLDLMAKYVQALAASGNLTPHKPLERKLLEMANLPQPPEEEDAFPLPASDTAGANGEGPGLLPAPGEALGNEQVTTILSIAGALKRGELDRTSAIAALSASLAIPEADADRFLPEGAAPADAAPAEGAPPPAPLTDTPAPGDGGPAEPDIQKAVMNGAQVGAMVAVAEKVVAGMLPRDTAIGILAVGFQMTPKQAEQVLASAGAGFEPPTPAAPAAPSGMSPTSADDGVPPTTPEPGDAPPPPPPMDGGDNGDDEGDDADDGDEG